MPVLYGVFLYMGVNSLFGVQVSMNNIIMVNLGFGVMTSKFSEKIICMFITLEKLAIQNMILTSKVL